MSELRTVLLVDGYSLLFRAFHALPLLTSEDGTYTNAVHGFFSMLLKALGDFCPDALCVMMDVHAPTFRHVMYDAYKGTRKPMPEELRPQLQLTRDLLSAMNIPVFEMEGYEADDLLGTAARLANEQNIHAYVLTGDRDSLQLVNPNTNVILTRKGITEILLLDEAGVKENFGFTPQQVPDMKGLMGDTSDNIPGIAGVGEKTALKLMQEYGSLDAILAHGDEIKGKLGEKIRAGKEDALLSRDLGTIRRTAPIEPDFSACTWKNMKNGVPMLEKYGLKGIVRSIGTLLGGEDAPEVSERRMTGAAKRAGDSGSAASGFAPEAEEDLPVAPQALECMEFSDAAALSDAIAALEGETSVTLYTASNEISLYAPAQRKLIRIPCEEQISLLSVGLTAEDAFHVLEPLFSKVPLIVHGAKALFGMLKTMGVSFPTVRRDTMIAAYLLHTAQKDYSFEQCLLAEYPEESRPQTRDALTLYALSLRQEERLKRRNLLPLLEKMELPLTKVLFSMEQDGFLVDRKVLNELGTWFTREIEECREAVYEACGFRDFNLNSPRQLGEVLFEKLGLPKPGKKGATGYSTNAEVLEELSPYHPCIEPLLRYRKMAKLQSTYIDGLQQKLEKSRDGRVHTTFDQTAAVTGRISSQEPNLQNIPIRTEEGREIRRAFTAPEGCVLLDADYSQIELRVLAHMSGDEAMCDAFNRGQDIHARTAAEINGVSLENVTAEMRRAAKAVNFGIVYGISAFGLSRNAGISRKEADAYIKRYFERYPGVRAFMDDCVEKGKRCGYAQTLFGRRRELFELLSPNRNVRSFGERAAMNTPVQGTAADIIKLAMVQTEERLKEAGLRARLILQVHDELIVECPEEEVQKASEILQSTMQNVIALKVPLLAEISSGKDWNEAH